MKFVSFDEQKLKEKRKKRDKKKNNKGKRKQKKKSRVKLILLAKICSNNQKANICLLF